MPAIFRAWEGNVGLFLLYLVHLKKVQQQDHICREQREEAEWESLPGQSVGSRIYLVPPMGWSAFSWADKASPSSGRNLFPDASVTPDIYISSESDTPDPEGGTFWPSLFNIFTANKKLLAGFKEKGSVHAIVYWKMKSPHPRRRHHFRNFQLVHHPPPA